MKLNARLRQPTPLTVLMPVRDARHSVSLAIRDLTADMGASDELLVVDDGSSDGTSGILRLHEREDPRIRVIRTQGIGLVKALNLGLAESRDELVARADADDRYPRGRLDAQRACLETGVVLVSGDYAIRSQHEHLGWIPSALGHPFVALSLVNPQRVPHPGVAYRKTAVMAAGGYREGDFPAEDLGLWLRLMSLGPFAGVAVPVCTWSMSATSTSHRRQADQRRTTQAMLSRIQWSGLRSVARREFESELARYGMSCLRRQRTLLLQRDILSAFGAREAARFIFPGFTRHPVTFLESVGALPGLVRDQRHRDSVRRAWGLDVHSTHVSPQVSESQS